MVQEQSPSPTQPAALESPVSADENGAVFVVSEIIDGTPRRARRKARRKSPATKHHTTHLEWSHVKAVLWAVMTLQMNCSIDLMLAGGTDRERKAFIRNYIRVLSQALKRRTGKTLDYVIVYEKGGQADLHAHVICYMPTNHWDLVEKTHDGIIVAVSRLTTDKDRERKANYITKQRRPLSPDFERRFHHRYQRGAKPIPGRKLSMSRSAKEMIDKRSAERAL